MDAGRLLDCEKRILTYLIVTGERARILTSGQLNFFETPGTRIAAPALGLPKYSQNKAAIMPDHCFS